MDNQWCECEHESHGEISFLGKPHAYGITAITVTAVTAWGTFQVCRECAANGHMTAIDA